MQHLALTATHRLPYRRCFPLWFKLALPLLEVILLVMTSQISKEHPLSLQGQQALATLAVRLPN